MQLKIDTEEQTKKIASQIGGILRSGDIVFLIGTLGAGKTALARYLIQSLGDNTQNVPSPTFTLVQSYDLGSLSLDHYDLYRLDENNNADDIIELGWEDSLNNGVTLVEWPDRLGDLTPKNRLEIHLEITPDQGRMITFIPFGNMKDRSLESLTS